MSAGDVVRGGLRLEEQTAREDVAHAVGMFEDVKRTAMNCDFQSLERGLQLLRRALTKLAT
jgi:hypothetical protein